MIGPGISGLKMCSLMEENLIQVFQNKVKILVSHLKESDAAILGASALMWEL